MSDFERFRMAVADRYEVTREVGAGGMAVVYLATDPKLQRQVAVKVLRPELAAVLGRDRFLREIEIAGRLRHPHILPLYESGEADGFLFYVMPYVEGESLADRMRRETQLPIDDALRITREVADALGAAHAQGIMHRDIKPDNIMLDGGHAVVADFGIARAVDEAGGEKLTQTGLAIGTPAYMSPEQATATHGVDARTDVYALACVLYEMLAGEPPYTGPTAQVIIAKRFTDPIPSARRVRGAVPDAVDAAIRKALQQTPADRFASTRDFAAALTDPSMSPPVEEAPRRRWVAWAAGAAALVAVGLGLRQVVTAGPAGGEPVTVVMAATTAVGGDSALAPAVDLALERAILESRHVSMLSPRQTQLAFEALGRDPTARLDQETALAIARRAGVAAVVQPSVLQVGAGRMINVRVLAPDGTPVAVSQASAERDVDLLPALDSLQRDVRSKLGESRRDLDDSRSLLYVLTPSSEALGLYLQALNHPDPFQQLRYAGEAVAADSNFAVAVFHTVNVLQNVGMDFLAPTEHLMTLADRLPPGHRLYVEASAASTAERDFVKAVERGMLLLDVLPSSGLSSPRALAGMFNELSLAHDELGNADRAAGVYDAWRDSIVTGAADVDVYYGNRAMSLAQSGDYGAAVALLNDRGDRGAHRGGPLARMPEGWVAASGRRWAEAAQTFREIQRSAPSPPEQLLPTLFLATAEAVRGRPAASRVAFDRALNLARAIGMPELVAAARLLRAAAEFYALDAPQRARVALAEMFAEEVVREGTGRRFHAHGRALAAAICAVDPRASVEGPAAGFDCDTPVTTDSIHDTIETLARLGWEAYGDGDLQRAIDIGTAGRVVRAGGVGHVVRVPAALALAQQGQIDSAATVYAALSTTPYGLISNAPVAFLLWGYGLRNLAELDGPGAAEARARLREQWQDAEPEFVARVVAPLLGSER